MSTAVTIHENEARAAARAARQARRPPAAHAASSPASIAGIVLAGVTYAIGSAFFVPWGTVDANFVQVGQNALIAATYIAWVIGFMAGIGAFDGPIRWALGRDLTHADAEYMAGKDLGKWRYWKYTTDHKVVGMQYLVMSLVLLGLGGFLAMLIRTELGRHLDRGVRPELLQLDHRHARHRHGHRDDHRRGRPARELHRADHDRRTRHGLPAAQRPQLLAPVRRGPAARDQPAHGRHARRMERLPAAQRPGAGRHGRLPGRASSRSRSRRAWPRSTSSPPS